MLLDTSFLIDLQRELAGGRPRGAARFLNDHPEATPWISLITWMEFAEGYPLEREDACRLFLSRFPLILPVAAIAWRASRCRRNACCFVPGSSSAWRTTCASGSAGIRGS